MVHSPEMIVGLYAELREAQAAMYELEESGWPYPSIRMDGHHADDPDLPPIEVRELPDMFWSLAVKLRQHGSEPVLEILNRHHPLAIGHEHATNKGRDDVDRGAIAWRHYVFELPGTVPGFPETRGSSGTTGTLSTGVFSEGARAEGAPPLPGFTEKKHG